MNEYGQLRDELAQLQAHFEAKAIPLVPLYHDLLWSPDLERWTEQTFASLQAATGSSPYSTEAWELWPGGFACSRYYGNGLTPQTRLVDFRHLASRAYRLLSVVNDLKNQGRSVPDDFRLRLDCLADDYVDEPGSSTYFGWLELVSEAALYCPTARLQAENGEWPFNIGPGSKDVTATVPPSHISLHLDVFEASAEFLRYCLDPQAVVPLGNGVLPIHLPAPQEVPIWESFTGELWFRGRLVKKFSKPAPQQRRLLDAFDAHGWRAEIPNPFTDPTIAEYFTEELLTRTTTDLSRSLNTDSHIRFGAPNGGKTATWHTY